MSDIKQFFHCAKCLRDLGIGPGVLLRVAPPDESPRTYSRLEAGWTAKGFQVRCVRHDENIIHVDFKGQKVGTAEGS